MFTKDKSVETTAFAEFIRNARSRDKKRVYSDVLKKATDRQLATMRIASNSKHRVLITPVGRGKGSRKVKQ